MAKSDEVQRIVDAIGGWDDKVRAYIRAAERMRKAGCSLVEHGKAVSAYDRAKARLLRG